MRPARVGFTPDDPELGAAAGVVDDAGVVDATGADDCPVDEVDVDPPPQAETSSAEVARTNTSGKRERLTDPSSSLVMMKA